MDTIVLTPLGKSVAEDTTGRGPEFAVLSFLYETNGPADFEEIMNETNMDDEKCSMIVRKLIAKDYVKEL